MKRLILIFLVIASSMGCEAFVKKVPLAPASLDLAAQEFLPNKGKANIYIFRKYESKGSALLFQVFLNDRYLGEIGVGTYLLHETLPGDHVLSVGIIQKDSVDLATEEGKNYFFQIETILGFDKARPRIKEIEEDDGREAIIRFRRAQGIRGSL